MQKQTSLVLMFFLIFAPHTTAWADEYQDTIQVFKNAGQSSNFPVGVPPGQAAVRTTPPR